jgi:hypothetical protein
MWLIRTVAPAPYRLRHVLKDLFAIGRHWPLDCMGGSPVPIYVIPTALPLLWRRSLNHLVNKNYDA